MRVEVDPSSKRVEVLDAPLAGRRGGVECEGEGARVRVRMSPSAACKGGCTPPARATGERRPSPRAWPRHARGSPPSTGSPRAVERRHSPNARSSRFWSPELQQQAELDVDVDGRIEFGDAMKKNAPRLRILPCVAMIPGWSWSSTPIISSAMAGSSSGVEQCQPGVGVVQVAYDAAGRSRTPRGGPPAGTTSSCEATSSARRFTRQPVGEVRNGGRAHTIIEVQVMDELNGRSGYPESGIGQPSERRALPGLQPHLPPRLNSRCCSFICGLSDKFGLRLSGLSSPATSSPYTGTSLGRDGRLGIALPVERGHCHLPAT